MRSKLKTLASACTMSFPDDLLAVPAKQAVAGNAMHHRASSILLDPLLAIRIGAAFGLLLDMSESFVFLVHPVFDPYLILGATLSIMPRSITLHTGLASTLVARADIWFGRGFGLGLFATLLML